MEDEEDIPMSLFNLNDPKKPRDPRPLGHLHTFYLSGLISKADDYIEWFEIIRNATEADIIKIHINSPGGDLFTAIQFMRVMGESQANIIASIEGACMSAATMIFLSAKGFEISEHSMFMFHNYSGGMMGKGGEMYDNIIYERKWSEKILRGVYSDFLTEDEIKSILDNKDIWMDGEEVVDRLKEKEIKMNTPKRAPAKPRAKAPAAKKTVRKSNARKLKVKQ
jgi:ATP-dependent protease ClpP protease subunit